MIATILLLIPFCAYARPVVGLLAAFFSGLFVDIWFAKPLGMSAGVFVVVAFLINLYKNKFQATNALFMVAFSTIAITFAFIYVVSYAVSVALFQKSFLYALAEIPIAFLYQYIWNITGKRGEKSY